MSSCIDTDEEQDWLDDPLQPARLVFLREELPDWLPISLVRVNEADEEQSFKNSRRS